MEVRKINRHNHRRRIRPKVVSFFLIAIIIGSIFYLRPRSKSLNVPKYKQSNQWNLILVNDRNKIPKDYSPNIINLSNGQNVSGSIINDLQSMFDEMRAEGYNPEVTSGYRNKEQQQEIYDEYKKKYKLTTVTEKWVAKPGYSEHETGLALDVNGKDLSYSYDIYDWLDANCYKYGFVIRYGKDKEKITGISYEPWHIRYVGKENAAIMKEHNLSLEEYLIDYYGKLK